MHKHVIFFFENFKITQSGVYSIFLFRLSNIHSFSLQAFLNSILEEVENRLRGIGSFVERVHKMTLEIAIGLNRQQLSGSGEYCVN